MLLFLRHSFWFLTFLKFTKLAFFIWYLIKRGTYFTSSFFGVRIPISTKRSITVWAPGRLKPVHCCILATLTNGNSYKRGNTFIALFDAFLFKTCPGQFLLTSQGQFSHRIKADNFHTRQITDFAWNNLIFGFQTSRYNFPV